MEDRSGYLYLRSVIIKSKIQLKKYVDYVFAAAALKQVPSCEFYPMEAIKTNVLGIDNTLNAAINNRVKKIVVLSAPAKGMTLLNYCKIDSNFVDYATEKSSIKQGLYTPGGNIPVFSDNKILKSKPDYALLLAWNFSKEIIKNNIKFLKMGGKFIIPIPNVKIIENKK